MKLKLFLVALPLTALTLWLANCQKQSAEKADANPKAISKEEMVKRGEYLTTVLSCDDCHTPKNMGPNGPEFDMSRRLMGHPAEEIYRYDDKKEMVLSQQVAVFSSGMTAIAGPWGVSYTANLTPDDTGIGTWTEAQFMKAIREGKSKGLDDTRPLLPPMPWFVYRNLTDDDLKSVFAYLQTLKPIKNVVPQPVMWN